MPVRISKMSEDTKYQDGIILKLTGGNYYVKTSDTLLKCRARGLFRHQDIKPVVGDYVKVEVLDHEEGYIVEIYERKNELMRPPIANIDQALIIMSYLEPKLSYNLIDKFLAIIEFHNIKPIIIITKDDLAASQQDVVDSVRDYLKSGYVVLITSINDAASIEQVKKLFKDKVSVLVGQSGAGKSSLLNAIDVELNLETNKISKALNRGKHTTRHVEIFETPYGMITDSPGFSSLSLDDLSPLDLARSYHDFQAAAPYCQFNNCLHENEPNCRVKDLVAKHEIPQKRYDNYLAFLQEIKERKVRY